MRSPESEGSALVERQVVMVDRKALADWLAMKLEDAKARGDDIEADRFGGLLILVNPRQETERLLGLLAERSRQREDALARADRAQVQARLDDEIAGLKAQILDLVK